MDKLAKWCIWLSRVSPPKTLPKSRNESDRGRMHTDITSIIPNAKNIGNKKLYVGNRGGCGGTVPSGGNRGG